jgi:hypothetical protein
MVAEPGRPAVHGTIVEAFAGPDGTPAAYAWRRADTSHVDHPWHDTDHAVVSVASAVRAILRPTRPPTDVPASDPARPAEVTGPEAVRIDCDGQVARITDPVHGVLEVDADRLKVTLGFTDASLRTLLRRLAPGRPPPSTDIALITLAALVARAAPASWLEPSEPRAPAGSTISLDGTGPA